MGSGQTDRQTPCHIVFKLVKLFFIINWQSFRFFTRYFPSLSLSFEYHSANKPSVAIAIALQWIWTEKKNGKRNTHIHIDRAIGTTWVIIVTTGIPAALSHGVVNYPYGDRNYTACLFLSDAGYNIIAFQVIYFVCSLLFWFQIYNRFNSLFKFYYFAFFHIQFQYRMIYPF